MTEKYEYKQMGHNVDRLVEDVCNRFKNADYLKKDFAKVKKIIENKYSNFPKYFKETVAFTFYAKIIASTMVSKHRALRALEEKGAKEIDKILGYKSNYPKVSAENTIKRPTQRNLKILLGIDEVIDHRLNKFDKPWMEVPTNYRIDVKKHLIDSFELFGYHFEGLKEDATQNELPINKQEAKEQENTVKVSLNGEAVLINENATMLEFLKVIKDRTEQEVTITKIIETEVEL